MNDLTVKIEEWAIERNLHNADPTKQILKLGEEFGELCEGMAKGKTSEIIDAIGDMYVVLTILSMQLGTGIKPCVSVTFEEIKDRKGKMMNGVFIKDGDMS